MSSDKNMSVIWVGKENGVRKTIAVTPRGSKCPVPRNSLRSSNSCYSGTSDAYGAGYSPSRNSFQVPNSSSLVGYTWSRGHTGTTSQGFETSDEPDLSELANIDTSRLTELERLAIVARLYHAHEARASGSSSSGFSRYPGCSSSSTAMM
ncbi:hypothetical protein FA13DRAFT_1731897, partial [Coprinellus micaceus]